MDQGELWMNKELSNTSRRYTGGRIQATWKKYRDFVRVRPIWNSVWSRKCQVQQERLFQIYKYKRKNKVKVGLLLNRAGTLLTEDTKKADVLKASFVSTFTDKTSPQKSLTQEIREKECWKEDSPLGRENWVRDHLGKGDIHKSMVSVGMHPQVLRSW